MKSFLLQDQYFDMETEDDWWHIGSRSTSISPSAVSSLCRGDRLFQQRLEGAQHTPSLMITLFQHKLAPQKAPSPLDVKRRKRDVS